MCTSKRDVCEQKCLLLYEQIITAHFKSLLLWKKLKHSFFFLELSLSFFFFSLKNKATKLLHNHQFSSPSPSFFLPPSSPLIYFSLTCQCCYSINKTYLFKQVTQFDSLFKVPTNSLGSIFFGM